jgi:predicted amidohydrolase
MAYRLLIFLMMPGWMVAAQPAPGAPPRGEHVPGDLHLLGSMRTPWVQHIEMSRDGTRLAAAYFLPPINRPGTDWVAFVVQWDLQSGARTIIPDATHPIVFSPDGGRLVMGRFVRADMRGAMGQVPVEPVHWHFGDPLPIRVIEPDLDLVAAGAEQPVQYEVQWDRRGEIVNLTRTTAEPAPAPRWDRRVELTGAEAELLPAGLYTTAGRHPRLNLVAVADRRGIIEVWDTRAAVLRHVLRLDDKPVNTVLVAAVQAQSVFGEPQRNRRHLGSHVRSAAVQGARIIVLPEAAITGYLTPDLKTTWQVDDRPTSRGLAGSDPSEAAETVPGPSTTYFAGLARQYGVYLTVPLVEIDRRTGRFYNTLVLLGPRGEQLIHYRKRNPWPWAERSWATEGNLGNPVVDTRYGRLGVAICYDIHQQSAVLGREEIDFLLYSIAWVEGAGSTWFEEQLPAIASRHDFHIIGSNWTVAAEHRESGWYGFGQSCVIDRGGSIVARMGHDEGIVFADLPCHSPAE